MNMIVRFPAQPSADDLGVALQVLHAEIAGIDEAMNGDMPVRIYNKMRRKRESLERVSRWLQHKRRNTK